MRSYRVDSKTVRIEARDDAESIVLEVVRTGLARSRADRNDPPATNSSYAPGYAQRTRPFLKFVASGERCGGTWDVRGRGSRNPAAPAQIVRLEGAPPQIRLPARLVISSRAKGKSWRKNRQIQGGPRATLRNSSEPFGLAARLSAHARCSASPSTCSC